MAGRFAATLPKQLTENAARRPKAGASFLRILLAARLLAPAALLAGVVLFRQQIVDLIQSLSGLEFVFTVVHLYSTLGVRALLAGLAFAVFVGVGVISLRFAPRRIRTAIFACICAALVAFVLWYLGRGLKAAMAGAVVSGGLVAANALSSQRWSALLAHPRYGRLLNLIFWICIGIELLLPRGFLAWTGGRERSADATAALPRVLLGAAFAAGALAIMAPFPMLMQLGQRMFMSPAATIVLGPEYQIFSRYDVSDFARNPATGDIFLCGQEQNSPIVLRGGNAPAARTGIVNGGNEFCEVVGTDSFATVNKRSDELLIADPSGLQLRGRLRLDHLPHGEIFLSAFPTLKLLAVASEDENFDGAGSDVRIVDLSDMKVVQKIDAEVGYLIADPRRPVIYANHFAKNLGVRAWDVRTGELVAASSRFGRSDRMAFDAARNEVLATVPETGQIWRLDAATLKDKSPIETVFGARGLAIDPARDLLLVASFLTNELDVVDLKTGRSLRRYRLGPWLRDVLVVSDEGVAYVASRYGVYRVNYLR